MSHPSWDKPLTEPQRQLLIASQERPDQFREEVKRLEDLLEYAYSLTDCRGECGRGKT